ncbi:MAG TPA: hypothetical protein VMT89_06260, partial [Candidatus Acidoferrales bacterium]|nr:hypothetical protein [Candidatus Acidoferrales bacterium]
NDHRRPIHVRRVREFRLLGWAFYCRRGAKRRMDQAPSPNRPTASSTLVRDDAAGAALVEGTTHPSAVHTVFADQLLNPQGGPWLPQASVHSFSASFTQKFAVPIPQLHKQHPAKLSFAPNSIDSPTATSTNVHRLRIAASLWAEACTMELSRGRCSAAPARE